MLQLIEPTAATAAAAATTIVILDRAGAGRGQRDWAIQASERAIEREKGRGKDSLKCRRRRLSSRRFGGSWQTELYVFASRRRTLVVVE